MLKIGLIVKIATVHRNILGTIHESTCIAESVTSYCPAYEMKIPLKTGGNG
jgi:hypothetical protein